MSLRVGIDLDGVVHDFVGAYRQLWVTKRHKAPEDLPEPTRWELYEDWGTTAEQFVVDLKVYPEICFDGPVIAGALEGLEKLKADGHSIHIVTNRPHEAYAQTIRWLRLHQIPYDTLTFAADKTIANVDMFLEDNVDNYRALRAAGVDTYLLAQPWNGVGTHLLGGKVRSWAEFLIHVSGEAWRSEHGIAEGVECSSDCGCRPHLTTTNPKDAIGLTKAPLRLLPAAGLIYTAKAMELGAEKYGPFNWRETPVRLTVYLEAAMRHLLRAMDGEDADPESAMPPAAHVAACMVIVLDALATGNLIDDRPTPGAAARLIEELTP